MPKKKDLFGWWTKNKSDSTFTVEEVKELVEEIKKFNCGAIDDYLSKHADERFNAWLENKKLEK